MSHEIKDVIINIRDKYSGSRLSANKTIEVEFRLGRYIHDARNIFLDEVGFRNLMDYFKPKEVITSVSEDYGNQYRLEKDIVLSKGEKKTFLPEQMITKRKMEEHKFPKYGVNISVSEETNVEKKAINGLKLISQRFKTRYVRDVGLSSSVQLQMHLTKVIFKKEGSRDSQGYEAELEIPFSALTNITPQDAKKLQQFLINLDMIIMGTDSYISYSDKMKKLGEILKLVDPSSHHVSTYVRLDYDKFSILTDLTRRNILNISGKSIDISHKYDGKRMFAYLDKENSLFLFSPQQRLNKLAFSPGDDYPKNIMNKLPIIIEGELVIVDKKNIFFVYDVLVYDGKVTTISHYDRMVIAKDFFLLNKFITGYFFAQKSFYFSHNFDSFTETCQYLFDQVDNDRKVSVTILDKEEKILTDGLVFIDQSKGYKWKPLDQMTVDLKVKIEGGKVNLYSYTLDNGSYKEVVPSWIDEVEIDLTPDQVDDSEIVELSFTNKTLKLYRKRPDKPSPNKINVVEDIWRRINDPVTKELLTGDQFGLIFSYHNDIKAMLLDRKAKYLLDIGAGLGGDLSKYHVDLKKIVLIEPDPSNYEQLLSRIKNSNLPYNKDKIITYNESGEDSNPDRIMIGGEKFDMITSMLSLSYLFKSQEIFEKFFGNLITSISSGGSFTFLSIDGNKIRNFIEKSSKDIIVNEDGNYRILFTQISMIVQNPLPSKENIFGRKVWVNIGNSKTAREIEEYMTDLDLLHAYLISNGFNGNLYDVADKETLNHEERVYNSFFTYGIYNKIKS